MNYLTTGGDSLKSTKFFFIVLFSIFFSLGLFLFHESILKTAGEYLAPNGSEEAEVLIIEGTGVVKNGAVNQGIRFLSHRKAKRLVVVLHQYIKDDQPFALQDRYTQLVLSESERMGLETGKFQVLVAPIHGHPITLNEAKFVVERISREGVKSAILVSEGFHTRRSWGVYSQEGAHLGLRIVALPYFTEYRSDNWWQHVKGVHDFFEESIKLVYYILRGYVSIKYLYCS